VDKLVALPKTQFILAREAAAERLRVTVRELNELVGEARKIAKDAAKAAAANTVRRRAPLITDIDATVGTQVEQAEIALSSRILTDHRREMKWSLHLGWLCWDGSRWMRDETNQVVGFAKQMIRQIYLELAAEMNK
jgi:hypothetical protein